MRGMTLRQAKCIVKCDRRGNIKEIQFKGPCDHVTLMPLIFATGQIMTPLVFLTGVEARYRKRSYGKYETPSNYFPRPNYLHLRPVVGVETDILYSWAKVFVKETH